MSVALVATVLAAGAAVADVNRHRDDVMLEEALRAARGEPSAPLEVTVGIGMSSAERARLEAQREKEIRDLIAQLRASASRRQPALQPSIPSPVQREQSPWHTETEFAARPDPRFPGRNALGARPFEMDSTGDDVDTRGRVAVLLVMNTAADRPANVFGPILCMEYGCYISTGSQAPATLFNFNQALGPIGRIGRGAGACNNRAECIFRNVDLGSAGATAVQPVTLRTGRPKTRDLTDVVADDTCGITAGQLSCSRPVRTDRYTLWAVPERIARRVGPETLEAALAGGLQTARAHELPWSRSSSR